jgi:putative ABC transport system permease protein
VTPEQLRDRIAQVMPHQVQVETGDQAAKRQTSDIEENLSFLRIALLVFAGVSLFVGAFQIFNTFSITVAQRTREFGMLRTLGASRRQILTSVGLEALTLGVLGAALGLLGGVGFAYGINELFKAVGIDLPNTGTVIATRTVIVSIIVGVVVTLVAALNPALRATRVTPMAALREAELQDTKRRGRLVLAFAILLGTIGLAMMLVGLFGGIDDSGSAAGLLGGGAALILFGVSLFSPRLVRPLASVTGRPLERLRGLTGRLARENATRQPGRTAATAAALMIGIALVAFSAVLAQGMRESTKGALAEQVRADYVLVGQDGWSPIDPDAANAVGKVPGVQVSTGLVQDKARAFGDKISVDGVDEQRIPSVFGFDWKSGSDSAYSKLGSGGAIVTETFAEDHHLAMGDRFRVTAIKGDRLGLTVAGISKPDKFNPLAMGEVTIAKSVYDRSFTAERERYAFVAADGASRPALERALGSFPDVKLQSKSEFETDQSAWVDQILGIFYVLLGLAVIVSLFGIVNTLALSVLERTRELGMLRAIGMSRRQVRRMVRHESVVTALIGAVLGIAIGLFLAGLATAALSGEGLRFAVPVGSLVAFTVVAAVAGVLAAIGPARRASRLDVLKALQYE